MFLLGERLIIGGVGRWIENRHNAKTDNKVVKITLSKAFALNFV